MAHRVIVWGTGNVGVPALRIVLSNPALELAGVLPPPAGMLDALDVPLPIGRGLVG
jgi:hypothetical protein